MGRNHWKHWARCQKEKKNLKWSQVLGNLKDVRITNKGCTHPLRAKLMELIPVVLTGSDTVHCEVTTILCLYPVGEKSMPIINYDQPRARIQTPQFTLDITSMLPYFQQQFIMWHQWKRQKPTYVKSLINPITVKFVSISDVFLAVFACPSANERALFSFPPIDYDFQPFSLSYLDTRKETKTKA